MGAVRAVQEGFVPQVSITAILILPGRLFAAH